MRCGGCGFEFTGGIGTRCPSCGALSQDVRATPMEYVVRLTGSHRAEASRRRVLPLMARVLYAAGFLMWALPIGLYNYYRHNRMPGASLGWRAMGVLLAVVVAGLTTLLCWASAFFYTRFVTSDEIAREAERHTGH